MVAGLAQTIVTVIQVALGMTTGASFLDPQQLRELAELGVDIDPDMLDLLPAAGLAGGVIGASTCCLGSLAVGAALGAIGGAIFAAVKSE